MALNKLLFYLLLTVFSTSLCRTQNRPLRYTPDDEAFVITNGSIKFNRALYGGNSGFRVETGDVPEFAFYLPGMGGNIQLGIQVGDNFKWLNDFDTIVSTYIPGKRIYVLKDSILEKGVLKLTALATYQTEGFIIQLIGFDLPENTFQYTIYGGGTAKKFSRNGDLNADPPDIFDLKREYCIGNQYSIKKNFFIAQFGQQTKYGTKQISGVFPKKTELHTIKYTDKDKLPQISEISNSDSLPIIIAITELQNQEPDYFYFEHQKPGESANQNESSERFATAEKERQALTNRVKIKTPDPFVNTLGGILATAGDAIWDGTTYQHGAVGWRVPLPGWRGAYVADVLGWHGRAETHFSAYALSQVTEPNTGPMVMDTARNLTRGLEKMGTSMFSEGYICRKPGGNFRPHHYDMNLVFIDALLWNFNWTGDTTYVRHMWPLIKRHLAWEKRNFDPDNDGLYDAYAAIWASDALQYSSGAVTHSSAYNYRSNLMAAKLAKLLNEDPLPYQTEADKIFVALNERLWLSEKGWWAEYQEFFEKKQLHDAAAVWTIYHALESGIANNFQAYQALRYIDNEIPHIPVMVTGVKHEELHLISTTNWMPYSWSINNVAYAEILHTSLAYWQGGRNEEAFKLWKGGMLDAMYLGSSPGNVVQISHYDAARGETYRDFADPTGMLARSTIQGLFGILPNALDYELLIRPGFPADWDSASLSTPDIDFDFIRKKDTDQYTIRLKYLKGNKLTLNVPAYKNSIEAIELNGQSVKWTSDTSAVGQPRIILDCGIQDNYRLTIKWKGNQPVRTKEFKVVDDQTFTWNSALPIIEIYDPQKVFTDLEYAKNTVKGNIQGLLGHRTAFAKVSSEQLIYWLPLHIYITKAVEIIPIDNNSEKVQFMVLNNTSTDQDYTVKIRDWDTSFRVSASGLSDTIIPPAYSTVIGTNRVEILLSGSGETAELNVINWQFSPVSEPEYETVEIEGVLNARISDIYKNKYLSPRSPWVTLQIPWQGIGEWCHPWLTADIDESGLIESSRLYGGIYRMPNGIPFSLPMDTLQQNIAYTSLWDNYADSILLQLKGKAAHAYFLMAGSTNHMQSRFVNGSIRVYYKDGNFEELDLVNPDNWCPIEQDYYHDGMAFNLDKPRPWRIQLSTGKAFRDAEDALGIEGVYTRQIEGGAATVLDIPLNPGKELDRLCLKTKAYEVVVGVSAVTLLR